MGGGVSRTAVSSGQQSSFCPCMIKTGQVTFIDESIEYDICLKQCCIIGNPPIPSGSSGCEIWYPHFCIYILGDSPGKVSCAKQPPAAWESPGTQRALPYPPTPNRKMSNSKRDVCTAQGGRRHRIGALSAAPTCSNIWRYPTFVAMSNRASTRKLRVRAAFGTHD